MLYDRRQMGKICISFLLMISVLLPISATGSGSGQGVESLSPLIEIKPTGLQLGNGQLREPLGIAADTGGNVYIADAMTGKVFRFSTDGSYIEFEKPSLNISIYPIDVTVHGSFVYVLDYSGNRILRYDNRGAYMDILLSFDNMEHMHPVSITGGGGGRFLTTDIENHGVAVWTSLLDIELFWKDFGWAEGSLDRPVKAAMLPDERIVVAELGNRRVQIFSPSGAYESVLTVPGGMDYVTPRSLCADYDGNIFVADTEGGAVYVFNREGLYIQKLDSFNNRKIAPSAVAVGWDDRLYVADIHSRTVLIFNLKYSGK